MVVIIDCFVSELFISVSFLVTIGWELFFIIDVDGFVAAPLLVIVWPLTKYITTGIARTINARLPKIKYLFFNIFTLVLRTVLVKTCVHTQY